MLISKTIIRTVQTKTLSYFTGLHEVKVAYLISPEFSKDEVKQHVCLDSRQVLGALFIIPVPTSFCEERCDDIISKRFCSIFYGGQVKLAYNQYNIEWKEYLVEDGEASKRSLDRY